MKKLFTFLLMVSCMMATAQNSGLFDRVRVNTSLEIPVYSALPATAKPRAMLYVYNGIDSALYIRSYSGNYWIKFGSQKAGSGLTLTNNFYTLGGELTQNTTLYSTNKFIAFNSNADAPGMTASNTNTGTSAAAAQFNVSVNGRGINIPAFSTGTGIRAELTGSATGILINGTTSQNGIYATIFGSGTAINAFNFSNGIAGNFFANSGTALQASSNTSIGASIETSTHNFPALRVMSSQTSATNFINYPLRLENVKTFPTQFSPGAGTGIKFSGSTRLNSLTDYGNVHFLLSDTTEGAIKTTFEILNKHNGILQKNLILNSIGQLNIPRYTGSTFDAVPFKNLGLDENQNLVTFDPATITIIKPVDQDKINITNPQSDDHLFYNLIAGKRYRIELYLIFQIGDPAADAAFEISGPASDIIRFYYTNAGSNSVGFPNGNKQSVLVGNAGTFIVNAHGIIHPTVSGNFAVQFSQNTASATATTMLKGSHIIITTLL